MLDPTVVAFRHPPQSERRRRPQVLMLATFACMKLFGHDTMLVDENDTWAPGRLAMVNTGLVLCERPGDRASRGAVQGHPRIDRTKQGKPFKLAQWRALFVLHEQRFYIAPDYRLQCVHDSPRLVQRGVGGDAPRVRTGRAARQLNAVRTDPGPA
jgi:hypothetical protein